ncbi:MAG TPA: hypothetical protein VIX63_09660, partial [Vicinamibacterales bacterium]
MTPSTFIALTVVCPKRLAVFLGVMLCAVSWPAAASAQDEAFRRGLEARDDGNWTAVVTEMQEAVKSDPRESTRRVGGGLFRQGTEYLPHFFLGEALFNQKLCARAVEEWWISEQQGAIRGRKEFVNIIANGYKACAARGVLLPVEFNQQQGSTTQVVTEATALAERVTKLGGSDVWTPDIHEQYARASAELTAAQARLAAGTASRVAAHFAEARAAAGRATTLLRGVESAVAASIENLAAVRRQVREVNQIISAAETGDRAIDSVTMELSPELAMSRRGGRDLLGRARDSVRAGEKTQNLATVNEGLRSAQDALSVFKDVLDGANRLVAAKLESQFNDVLAIASEAVSFLDTAIATLATRVLGKQPPAGAEMTSQLEAFQKRATTIRRRLDTAQKTQNVNGLKDAARLAVQARAELDTVITSFGPATLQDRGVHAALADGARLFFAGEYQQVLSALETSALEEAPLQLHVHLFRAAALFHLYVRSGEKDQALRARAVGEIDACKRLNAAFTPDPRAFAPRFLEFFQSAAAP